ncbi:MAG: anthranilate synthase component I [bacterium]|nr:anthranilate synthase component I [bacterium]
MPSLTAEEFVSLATRELSGFGPGRTLAIPVGERVLSDQLTPVLAYRRLVASDARRDRSFLFESVEGGERQGRYSIMGAQPTMMLTARANRCEVVTAGAGAGERVVEDPLNELRRIAAGYRFVRPVVPGPRDVLPACVLGGWIGYAGYDSVRYCEPGKLPFSQAPADDRGLADLDFAFYDGVVAFDHVDKVVHVVRLAMLKAGDDPARVYRETVTKIAERITMLETHSKPLRSGVVGAAGGTAPPVSNTSREAHGVMLAKAKEYIRAGDIFQVVLGQRFERSSEADPFDVYRALRAVNPSPYMVYMQCEGCILVASSPEILCRVKRVEQGFEVTTRPLAGTRRRGKDAVEDAALERELLADPKERAEHIMLVDLGRNDVGRVAEPGTIQTPALMQIERYSHVMHISSTVTGRLREGLDCWDALRAALPVGTISGAPKVRAMQVIDELESVRRGPYGGGMGYVGLDGQMDVALTLRTMVVPTALATQGQWVYHLQASGGIVADSETEAEYQETVNKAAGLARAIDVAESAFGV